MDEYKARIIGALLQKLGGKAEFNELDIDTAPEVIVTRHASGKVELWVVEPTETGNP